MNNAIPLPKESIEQTRLFQWARAQSGKYPELALMFHIPNGGSRHKAEARNLKGQGVKAGVPDLCLPVARCGCHGLFIELKRQKGGRVSDAQDEWVKALAVQGYCVAVCLGWEAASNIILHYLQEKPIGRKPEGNTEIYDTFLDAAYELRGAYPPEEKGAKG